MAQLGLEPKASPNRETTELPSLTRAQLFKVNNIDEVTFSDMQKHGHFFIYLFIFFFAEKNEDLLHCKSSSNFFSNNIN